MWHLLSFVQVVVLGEGVWTASVVSYVVSMLGGGGGGAGQTFVVGDAVRSPLSAG